MKCPHCGKEIPEKIVRKEAAAFFGSMGGKATGPTKARTSEQARRAALARWGKGKKGKSAG